MKCERFRELILTDYLDDQLAAAQKKAVDAHMSVCEDCRRLAETARQLAVEPFQEAEKAVLPRDEIWHRVKDRILSETAAPRTGTIERFLERFRDTFALPGPVFGVATLAAVALMAWLFAATFYRTEQYVRPSIEDINQSIAYVIEEISLYEENNGGYGTAIEEYFL